MSWRLRGVLLLVGLSFTPDLYAQSNPVQWIRDRLEPPKREDYIHGVVLSSVNVAGYAGTAIYFSFPIEAAVGITIYQASIAATETIYLRSLDNLSQNRLPGGEPQFSRLMELSLRLLRHWAIAQGFRWVSGPILGAQPINSTDGQLEILWNVAAFGASQSIMAISRARYLSPEAGQVVNAGTFAILGALGSLDLMGAHLFDIPYLSDVGIHGSNVLIWATGALGAWMIWKFPEAIQQAAIQLKQMASGSRMRCHRLISRLPFMRRKP